MSDLKLLITVVKNLSEGYDMNFGVRSVVNEVRRIAVQQLAEAHIRDDIKTGCALRFLLECSTLADLRFFIS